MPIIIISTGLFNEELTLYPTLVSGKDTAVKIPSFTDQKTVAMSHNKQLIGTVRTGV